MTRRGFTLVELLVSIAMVLIIILGVNAIFKMASDTVNAGQALAAANRDNRAIQSIIYDDFRTAVVTDGPCLFIRSERVEAFRNRADELADRDGNPLTTDMDGDNNEGEPPSASPGELSYPLVYNGRNHRTDRIGFFGRGLYRRQTGTENSAFTSFIDDRTTDEAFIWYGHLAQPNGVPDPNKSGRSTHLMPGEKPTARKPNPNNYFATDWILGRSVTLLTENPDPAPPPGSPPNPYPPNWIAFTGPTATSRLHPLNPMQSMSAKVDMRSFNDYLASGRYDIADGSIRYFRDGRNIGLSRYPGLRDDAAFFGVKGITGGAPAAAWWEIMAGRPGPLDPAGTDALAARFQGYPYPDKPLTAAGLARTVPVWVRGCTQFMVEYAGDYLKQDPANGAITDTYISGSTDGEVDYMYVVEQGHASEPPRSVRRVRWYGMPRNVDTFDDVNGVVIAGGSAATPKHGNLYDVIPLRDLLMASGKITGTTPIPADFFEHFIDLPMVGNYATATAPAANYYAAWGPQDLVKGSRTKPKMLRFTVTVDDPSGRMTEGQTFEYVVDVP